MSSEHNPRHGAVHRLYHRINELRPAWEICASYLLVHSLNGDEFYVPPGISAGRDAQRDHLLLTVTASRFPKRTWTRLPVLSFLAKPGRQHSQPGNQSKRIPRQIHRTHKTSADFLRWLKERNALAQQTTEVNTERTDVPQDGN